MRYGKHITQADRNESKLYPNREPKQRKARKPQPRTQAESELCYALFGYDPVEEEAKMNDAAEDAAMYSDLRYGG